MIELRSGTRIWLAAGITDMRRGFHELSAQVQILRRVRCFRLPDDPREHLKDFTGTQRYGVAESCCSAARTISSVAPMEAV